MNEYLNPSNGNWQLSSDNFGRGLIAWKTSGTSGYRWSFEIKSYRESGFSNSKGMAINVFWDVSDKFDSPFHLTALTEFPLVDSPGHGGRNKELINLLSNYINLHDLTNFGSILPKQRKSSGYDDFPERFNKITRLKERSWLVTNRCPKPKMGKGDDHKNIESFYGSFADIPLSMLRRYWNKAVCLNSRPRMQKNPRVGHDMSAASWRDYLFDSYTKSYYQCREIPISPGLSHKRELGHKDGSKFVYNWVGENNVKRIHPFSSKPFFAKPDDEFLFLMDVAAGYS